jgi:hypothetical protein
MNTDEYWRPFSARGFCMIQERGRHPRAAVTTGLDTSNLDRSLIKNDVLEWANCLGVYFDTAPVVIESRLEFCTPVKKVNPNVIISHCLLHRWNLATHQLQPELHLVLKYEIRFEVHQSQSHEFTGVSKNV